MADDARHHIVNVAKADFDRDRVRYMRQASAQTRVIVRHAATNAVSAVFGGSLDRSPELDPVR